MTFLSDHNISHANWALNDKAEGASALEPGASSDVTVAFAPPSPGPYSCLIGTGTFYCDGVPCSGVGILMEPECTVVPSELDFGEVIHGTVRSPSPHWKTNG